MPTPLDALADHTKRAESFRMEANALDRRATFISVGRLVTFLGAAIGVAAGVLAESVPLLLGGLGAALSFLALLVLHAQVLKRLEGARIRAAVHERHMARITGGWTDFASSGQHLLPAEHEYAFDVDLLGEGSLFQRLDVTHTVPGEQTLGRWLGAPADPKTVRARQAAVEELAQAVVLRQELEAAAEGASGTPKLDPSPFLEFTARKRTFDRARWLVPVIHLLPLLALGLFLARHETGLAFYVLPLVLQGVLTLAMGREVNEAFDLVAARRGYVEALRSALAVVEGAQFESPLLVSLRKRVLAHEEPPSRYLRRLDRWAGLAELRYQFLVQLVANVTLLWDLHVLYRLERWSRDVGPTLSDVFEALGELEALASLATLLRVDAAAHLPEIVDESEGSDAPAHLFEADEVCHPLLPSETRVPNDVALPGPGTALIVTGSNMAGKSTLLRAVGLNVALALAGGPVTARAMRIPRVRLRASMRADDSLQRGASYFHAELTKIHRVVDGAEEGPPVFFLLDELLRGTNARARHLGARAIVEHLLARRALGLVATHDVALAALAKDQPSRILNAHFTDVMRDGEMIFDYRLRPGIVRTSNALRLLRKAGIEVPEQDLRESENLRAGVAPSSLTGAAED